MAVDNIIIWDQVKLSLYMRDPDSAVGRDLARRAIQVESAAKINASGRPGPNVITGRLRSSIHWTPGEDGLGQFVDVGTDVYYARWVEEGHPNRPHAYRGRDGQVHWVFRPAPAYRFLRPALAAALL